MQAKWTDDIMKMSNQIWAYVLKYVNEGDFYMVSDDEGGLLMDVDCTDMWEDNMTCFNEAIEILKRNPEFIEVFNDHTKGIITFIAPKL